MHRAGVAAYLAAYGLAGRGVEAAGYPEDGPSPVAVSFETGDAVDEKSQALDRTAPCLPMLPTTPARMTHDYVRNGTTSLFAALDLASGSVIAQPYRRHRHQRASTNGMA